jgi:hypothetical protein
MKFYKGQIVELQAKTRCYNAPKGSRAVVVNPELQSKFSSAVWLDVKWLGEFDQNDGGYERTDFIPVATKPADLKKGDRVVILSSYDERIIGALGTMIGHILVEMDENFHQFDVGYRGSNGKTIKTLGGITKASRIDNEAPATVAVAPEVTVGATVTMADELQLKPQARKILAHLKSGKTISPEEARTVYAVYRLAASIHEIRQIGYKVKTTNKEDAAGHRYARYELKLAA